MKSQSHIKRLCMQQPEKMALRILELEDQLDTAVQALRFYAGESDGMWVSHVCDSYSGLTYAFDWNGDTQDEPHEVATRVLSKLKARGEGE